MMDKTTAQRTASQTFKAAFDARRYRDFINELCNGFDESKKQTMQVPDGAVAVQDLQPDPGGHVAHVAGSVVPPGAQNLALR